MSAVIDNRDPARLSAAIRRAQAGDADALDAVLEALQHDVFRIALRMTAHVQDAEDAAQEILVKIARGLPAFRGDSSIRTWSYRVAVRHLLDRRRSRVEALALDFDRYGADLVDGLAAEPDPDPLAIEEVKRGCTLAMLACLDRPHRVAFVLSDVFDLPHERAAGLSGVSEVVYRQRLSRARRALEAFTRAYCGLVNRAAPCTCSRRVARAEALGRLHRERPALVGLGAEDVAGAVDRIEGLHTTARLMREHPSYLAPAQVLERVRAAVGGLKAPPPRTGSSGRARSGAAGRRARRRSSPP